VPVADPEDPEVNTDSSRELGLCICRGPSVMVVAPDGGFEEIANPFEAAEEEDAE
jgi:U6 snRNA-associated Sm-like protein LSm7